MTVTSRSPRLLIGIAATVVLTVVCAATAWRLASSSPELYESATRVLIGGTEADIQSLRASDMLTSTYAELVTSDVVLRRAIDRLGIEMDPAKLADGVNSVGGGGTRLLTIRVQLGDRRLTAQLADALAAELEVMGKQIDPVGGAQLDVIEPAEIGAPVSKRATLIGGLGGVVGALIGLALTLLLTARRRAPDLPWRPVVPSWPEAFEHGGDRSIDGRSPVSAGVRTVRQPPGGPPK